LVNITRFVLLLGCAALASIGFDWVAPGQRLESSLAFLSAARVGGSDVGKQTPPNSKVFYMEANIDLTALVLNPHKEEWKCTT
jgi:hypothetical protein